MEVGLKVTQLLRNAADITERFAFFGTDFRQFSNSDGRDILAYCKHVLRGNTERVEALNEDFISRIEASPEFRGRLVRAMNSDKEGVGLAIARLWVQSWENSVEKQLFASSQEISIFSKSFKERARHYFADALGEAYVRAVNTENSQLPPTYQIIIENEIKSITLKNLIIGKLAELSRPTYVSSSTREHTLAVISRLGIKGVISDWDRPKHKS